MEKNCYDLYINLEYNLKRISKWHAQLLSVSCLFWSQYFELSSNILCSTQSKHVLKILHENGIFCGLKYITMRWLKQAFHEYFLDFKKRFLLSDMQRVTEVIRYTYLENNVTVKVVWLWKHFLLFAVYLERGHNRIVRCSITKTNNKNFIFVLSCKDIMITKKICKWVEKSEKDTIFWTIVHTKFVI